MKTVLFVNDKSRPFWPIPGSENRMKDFGFPTLNEAVGQLELPGFTHRPKDSCSGELPKPLLLGASSLNWV